MQSLLKMEEVLSGENSTLNWYVLNEQYYVTTKTEQSDL